MHLKRLKSPRSWPIKRKQNVWIARPSPGPHSLNNSITLNTLIKDILGYAKTKREVKKILNDKKLLINNSNPKDYNLPIGVMDLIEIPSLNENYVVFFNKKGKFSLNKIKDVENKIFKINDKTKLKKGKLQLNLSGGKNILINKDEYKVGDSLILNLKDNKIKAHLKLEKGATIYLIDGSYKGYMGEIVEIKNKVLNQKAKIIFKIDNKTYETLKDYAFVIEKNYLGLKQNE